MTWPRCHKGRHDVICVSALLSVLTPTASLRGELIITHPFAITEFAQKSPTIRMSELRRNAAMTEDSSSVLKKQHHLSAPRERVA